MGLIDYHYYAWKPQPGIYLKGIVVVLSLLFLSSVLMVYGITPLFYPGIVMAFAVLWMTIGLIHWIKKGAGYQSKLFRIKPEHCVKIVKKVLNELGLEYETIEEKANLIFLWTVYYDLILHIPKEGISVCFRYFKLQQATGIFVGKVSPSNMKLIESIKDGIDRGTSPRYLEV